MESPLIQPACMRRCLLRAAASVVVLCALPRGNAAESGPERRWYEAAVAMRRLAESWGDQSYGAVVVAAGVRVGEGPSRVVKNNDPTAHAEREAIRDAQRRLGRTSLEGSTLYSTSRPCRECERAAAQAKVARMIFGADLHDAGSPRP